MTEQPIIADLVTRTERYIRDLREQHAAVKDGALDRMSRKRRTAVCLDIIAGNIALAEGLLAVLRRAAADGKPPARPGELEGETQGGTGDSAPYRPSLSRTEPPAAETR